jgi:Putative prokaryotic signal transducing protein
MSALRRRGQGDPPRDEEAGQAMKELLRSNDPVLLSYVSALLEQERIDFIVADLNMSVLEGSIGALPRRVLVETDKIAQARHILTGAGIGNVIADDEQT